MSPAPAARHYRRDIKGGRKRNNRPRGQNSYNNNNGNRQQRCGLNNQTLKITIRNIINCESTKDVVDMIREILKKANASLTTKILLDEASIQKLLRTEELIMEAEKEADATAKQDGRDGEGEIFNDQSKYEHEKNNIEMITKSERNDETVELSKMSIADIVKGSEELLLIDVASAISARFLYTILPHVSKRRGLKSGCAYLILQAPIIKTSDRPLDAAEAAKFTAIGRLQLALALESLVTVAKVESSLSGKVWRDKDSHRDRREGTITTTSDYKAFLAQQEAHSLEIQARTKPAPGGGGLPLSTPEQENHLAAIVVHLRAKRAEKVTNHNVKKNVKKDMGASVRGKGDSGNNSSASGKQNTSNNKNSQQSTKNSRQRPKQQPRRNKKAGANAQVLPKSSS